MATHYPGTRPDSEFVRSLLRLFKSLTGLDQGIYPRVEPAVHFRIRIEVDRAVFEEHHLPLGIVRCEEFACVISRGQADARKPVF